MPPPTASIAARVSERATVVEVRDRFYLRVDAEGRWTAYGEGGVLFRRGVDGSVVRPRGGGIETCTPPEADAIRGWVVRRAGEVLELLSEAPAGSVQLLGDATLLRERLQRAACGDEGDGAGRRAAYEAAYPEPVPILPPHRYRDLVVLPATGCPNHRCRFCAFYRDRPFRILDDGTFTAHLEAVERLFGAALCERDGVFLGSASALSLSDAILERRLAQIARVFGAPRRGVAAFHDPDRSPPRAVREWARLVEGGLVEATLGLETAERSLRRAAGKSDDLERFARAVGEQKAAGLSLSLTVLLGLGGPARAAAHREATVAFLARLPLTGRDRVYLSPLADPVEAQRARRAPGGAALQEAEVRRWRPLLARATPARVGEYRIERFAFLA